MRNTERPDLLITDYHMPQLSGLELCQKLKQDPATARIPAIMLTARGYQLDPKDTRRQRHFADAEQAVQSAAPADHGQRGSPGSGRMNVCLK